MRISILLLVCLIAARAAECARWIRTTSANFELYTSWSEEEARRILEAFEQAHDFFAQTKPFPVTPGTQVVLVVFDSTKEYKPYSAKAFTPAYFTGDEQRDYIVMSAPGEALTRIAIHEYVHVLVQHSGLQIPLWLNEGLADVYSGMKVRNGRILVGYLPDDRARSLGSGSWMRLGALLSVGQDSAEYNEASRASMFYGQSCLLAHMLMLGEGYADRFSAFVDRLAGGASAQNLIGEVYGKSLGELEKEMLAYFRQSTIGGATYTVAAREVRTEPAREATELEVELVLTRLKAATGHAEEARGRLERLSAQHPEAREIAEAQVYLEWRAGNQEATQRAFERLFELGGSGWKTWWDYARFLHSARGDRAQKTNALRRALELKPEFTPARLFLGQELYASGKPALALAELKRIQDANPREEAAMFLLMARAAADVGDLQEARRCAEEAKRRARTPNDLAGAESTAEQDDQRPVLRRRAPNQRAAP